jgi:RNAse (barnase) inhibitor barstar
MRELVLDAASWRTRDDLYLSFFAAVGAPTWHGRNFDAIRDSIAAGQINKIEVPYCLVLTNCDLIHPTVKGDAENFIGLIRELAAEGVAVDIRTEPPP